jgi:hypothetical protein
LKVPASSLLATGLKGLSMMKRARCSTVSSSLVFTILLTFVGATLASSFIAAGATSSNVGLITGRVSECGPGPIVALPDPTVPVPKPISVKVERGGRTVAIESIKLPQEMPWSGTFRFSVPAGKYEVISTYRGVGQWVVVHAGRHSVVDFPIFACPMSD